MLLGWHHWVSNVTIAYHCVRAWSGKLVLPNAPLWFVLCGERRGKSRIPHWSQIPRRRLWRYACTAISNSKNTYTYVHSFSATPRTFILNLIFRGNCWHHSSRGVGGRREGASSSDRWRLRRNEFGSKVSTTSWWNPGKQLSQQVKNIPWKKLNECQSLQWMFQFFSF